MAGRGSEFCSYQHLRGRRETPRADQSRSPGPPRPPTRSKSQPLFLFIYLTKSGLTHPGSACWGSWDGPDSRPKSPGTPSPGSAGAPSPPRALGPPPRGFVPPPPPRPPLPHPSPASHGDSSQRHFDPRLGATGDSCSEWKRDGQGRGKKKIKPSQRSPPLGSEAPAPRGAKGERERLGPSRRSASQATPPSYLNGLAASSHVAPTYLQLCSPRPLAR
ncbi:uncharacterized protein LOC141514890 [Macrotis lagotis]|uniref:uncharacterized protein LOC141514890 n=1 Tax=Macrotis lagotis TaxID=92651 RepID=UPI003D686716